MFYFFRNRHYKKEKAYLKRIILRGVYGMNIKTYKSFFIDMMVMCIDLLLVLLSLLLPFRFYWQAFSGMHLVFPVTFTLTLGILFKIYEIYTRIIRKTYELAVSIIICLTLAFCAAVLLTAVFDFSFLAPNWWRFLLSFLLSFALILGWKMILIHLINKYIVPPKLLVVESKDVDSKLARKIKYAYASVSNAWYELIDTNDENVLQDLVENRLLEFDSVFVSNDLDLNARNLIISKAIELNKELYILPTLYNIMNQYDIVNFEDTPVLHLKGFRPSRFTIFTKRTMDVLLSFIGLVVSLPIMLLCAIAIRLDSKGPVFYTQERVTLHEKVFRIYKFRTMINDAEKLTGSVLSTENDPRITKVGKVLRSTRLDELPQLINILMGDMSIVGPRPERPKFVKEYKESIENYEKRFLVKAGLTGMAQVYGRYDTKAMDKTLYDLLYIKNYSLWQDIKLIFMTIKVMFLKESAQGVREEPVYTSKPVAPENPEIRVVK